MEVIQSIRKLLFLEDCVIIPGLGGFVSQYRPAVIDKITGTFIPPAKAIVFNGELVQNDGVLVSFIARQKGVSTEVARELVERFVDDTFIKLDHNTPVFIEGIGQFIRDKNREIRFQADAGTNLFLDSFGLASFHLREIVPEPVSSLQRPSGLLDDEVSITIDFPVSEKLSTSRNHNLRRIAIAMPLLIAFSLLPYNSSVLDTLRSSPASIAPEPSLFRLNYPDPMLRDTARVIVFPIAQEQTTEEVKSGGEDVKGVTEVKDVEDVKGVGSKDVKEVKGVTDVKDVKEVKGVGSVEVKSEEVKIVVGKYPVIAGCFKVKNNAEKLHKQLIDKGYPAFISTSRKGFYKVGMDSFATRQEALDGLARLKRAEPALQLWVAL